MVQLGSRVGVPVFSGADVRIFWEHGPSDMWNFWEMHPKEFRAHL